MSTKTKPLPAEFTLEEEIDWRTAPANSREQVLRIRRLGKRISEYISYMCKLGEVENNSAESKQAALNHFYERLVIVERQLGRIHEALRLG